MIDGILIDTTNNYLIICLLKGDNIEVFKKIKANQNLTSITNFEIDLLLKKQKVDLSKIKNGYIVIGPGSFTGIKIGLLIIKTWNEIYKFNNIFYLDSLNLLKDNNSNPIIDARGNQSYILDHNNKLKLSDNDRLESKLWSTYDNLTRELIQKNLKDFIKVSDIDKLSPIYFRKLI